jgi:radical SAM protein with 4Fe4S-binding SPASM domain
MLLDSNIQEAKEIKKLVDTLGIYHHFSNKIVPGRSGSLAPFRNEAVSSEFCQHYDIEWLEGDKALSDKIDVCQAGRGTCSISPRGDVFPCLLMPMKIGNLRTGRFSEFWKTSPVPELTYLRSLIGQDLESCINCSLAKYCKRCLGVAFSETGELTKPAPSACRNAALKAEFFERKGVIS